MSIDLQSQLNMSNDEFATLKEEVVQLNGEERQNLMGSIQDVAKITNGKAPESPEQLEEAAIQDALAGLSPQARAIAEKVLIGANSLNPEFLRSLDSQLIGSQSLAGNQVEQPGLQRNIGGGLQSSDMAQQKQTPMDHMVAAAKNTQISGGEPVDRADLSYLSAPSVGAGQNREVDGPTFNA